MFWEEFFYCCVCIRYRGKVSTEQLPSNDKGIFTEPLPRNDKGIHIQTDGREFFISAVEMGSGAVLYSYVPSCIKIGSGIQKLIRGIHTHRHRQQRDLISLLYFFKIRIVG
jgi:hypothetical protein